MKTLFYFISSICFLLLVSCSSGIDNNDPNKYCWEVDLVAYGQVIETEYVYATGYEINQTINESRSYVQAYGAEITAQKANSSLCGVSDNYNPTQPNINPNTCYKVTYSYMGVSDSEYVSGSILSDFTDGLEDYGITIVSTAPTSNNYCY